jgi:hypothetical protein
MSLFIKGDELYSKHFPVVGVTPTLYGFNNLPSVFGKYFNPPINRIQMYDGWSGKLLPSVEPATLLTEMMDNLKSNPNYAVQERQRIHSSLYNNDTKKFTVGLIGTEKDIEMTKKALDEYLKKN